MQILYRSLWIFIAIFSTNLLLMSEEVYVEDENNGNCYYTYQEEDPCCRRFHFRRENPVKAYTHTLQKDAAWPGARGGDFIDQFSR